MSFLPGNPGRPPGSLNKRSRIFIERIENEHGFDVAQELVWVFTEAKKTYQNYGTIYDNINDARIEKGENFFPTEDKADKYLKIALDAAREIASYCIPKLKSIEHIKNEALEGMTAEQKLEALRHATALLEAEVKKNEPTRMP